MLGLFSDLVCFLEITAQICRLLLKLCVSLVGVSGSDFFFQHCSAYINSVKFHTLIIGKRKGEEDTMRMKTCLTLILTEMEAESEEDDDDEDDDGKKVSGGITQT